MVELVDVHFSNKAPGNICTESIVALCDSLGLETGIKLDELNTASRYCKKDRV